MGPSVTLAGERQVASKIQGTVVTVDEQGVAITDIANDRLAEAPTDEQVTIRCEGHVTSCIFPPDHQQPEMTFLAVCGRRGFLELMLVGDSVASFLGIGPGSVVTVQW
jgi:S-adenosylmethionine hydrolase